MYSVNIKVNSHCTHRATCYDRKSYINHWCNVKKLKWFQLFTLCKWHHWFTGTSGRKCMQCELAFIYVADLALFLHLLCIYIDFRSQCKIFWTRFLGQQRYYSTPASLFNWTEQQLAGVCWVWWGTVNIVVVYTCSDLIILIRLNE